MEYIELFETLFLLSFLSHIILLLLATIFNELTLYPALFVTGFTIIGTLAILKFLSGSTSEAVKNMREKFRQ